MKTYESSENYLKAIYILHNQLDVVRSIDVAIELGVSKPSVSIAIKKLRNENYLCMDDNHYLILTEKGFEYAKSIFERHVIIEKVLTDLVKIDKQTAHEESCRLEHFLSEETINKIKQLYEDNFRRTYAT